MTTNQSQPNGVTKTQTRSSHHSPINWKERQNDPNFPPPARPSANRPSLAEEPVINRTEFIAVDGRLVPVTKQHDTNYKEPKKKTKTLPDKVVKVFEEQQRLDVLFNIRSIMEFCFIIFLTTLKGTSPIFVSYKVTLVTTFFLYIVPTSFILSFIGTYLLQKVRGNRYLRRIQAGKQNPYTEIDEEFSSYYMDLHNKTAFQRAKKVFWDNIFIYPVLVIFECIGYYITMNH